MVAVMRVIRPPNFRESAARVPRHQWRALAQERQHFCTSTVPDDCRLLLEFMQDGEQNDWLGFGSREQYIREALGLEPEMVEWALVGLERTKPEEAAPFRQMVELGRHGGDRRSEKAKDQGSTGNLKGGNNLAYTLARLKRDRPDLAEQVEAGKLSANAAAIQAGFRKAPNPLDQLRRAWEKATPGQRATFLREVGH